MRDTRRHGRIRDIASTSQWTETELIAVRCGIGGRPPDRVETFLRGIAQESLPDAAG
ncbi:MAG: hypothetical protein J2P19_35575 [Pseudonocardia sp.]|nr:hypothetical protein [Pseudonocardia sp.]